MKARYLESGTLVDVGSILGVMGPSVESWSGDDLAENLYRVKDIEGLSHGGFVVIASPVSGIGADIDFVSAELYDLYLSAQVIIYNRQ